ncbi:MAG: methyltransferase domain-containing protein [Bacteroidales bacterium]|nr:methyltransferase domain-containing protein [Bacteroidales bacterium]
MDRPYIIELGCGTTKMEGAIGVDRLPLPGVDIVADVEKGLPFLKYNSVDKIYSNHFFEHISNFEFLIKEIHRVLKKEGCLYLRVPHFSNPYFYSDYTHQRFFGLYTFDYFSNPKKQLRRKVPSFYGELKFVVVRRKMIFKSTFLIRGIFKHRIIQPLVNFSSYTQELYEEMFCYLIPCQEIYFEIKPDK